MNQEVFQVDAFTDRPFRGNPAGVCVLGALTALSSGCRRFALSIQRDDLRGKEVSPPLW